MTMFLKPTSRKAALKLGLFGPPGGGKTFSALLIAEGLARHTGKRVAVIDTEQGTAFYGQRVPERAVHPEAFAFDVLHSRSITQALAAVQQLDLNTYGVVVVDSISHLWDACKAAFSGKTTKIGTIPLHAWGQIKKPYKELMHLLLTLPVHVLICGRQSVDYAEDESGELKALGYKMRAEGETAYEPDVLLRLESHKPEKRASAIPVAHVEKDRSGILAGKSIAWPTFDLVAKPLLALLGPAHTAVPSEEEVAGLDAEALARQEAERVQRSEELAAAFTTRLAAAATVADLQGIGGELTPEVKRRLLAKDLERTRRVYAERLARLKQSVALPNGSAHDSVVHTDDESNGVAAAS